MKYKKIFESVTGTVKEASEEVTKSRTEKTKKRKKTITDL